MQNFGAWLRSQSYRSDPIGDLAREAQKDERLMGMVLTPDKLRSYVQSVGGDQFALHACTLASEAYKAETWNPLE